MKRDLIKNITDFCKIIREYYEQLYPNKFKNVSEMDKLLENKFLEKYKKQIAAATKKS